MKDEEKSVYHRRASGRLLIASLLILSGVLLFTRNMGWITNEIFEAIASWQTLLIIMGAYALIYRHYISGVILLAVGAYLLFGTNIGLPENIRMMVWPVALIACGILFFTKSYNRQRWINHHAYHHQHMRMKQCRGHHESINEATDEECQSEDGFLNSNNVFGGVRHVVLDEVFKGADVRTSFGGTTIDLRRTTILPGETYIDLDCSWGGVELYIPSEWKVVFKCNSFFGGYEDKRWQDTNVNQELILVIRGNISFGGLEIKD